MLMPKRVKYRKQMRGRMRGRASRGAKVTFGDYGLQAVEPCWMTSRQIEAARRAIVRSVRRGAIPPIRWNVERLTLVASTPRRGGSEYREVGSWPLGA